MKKRCPFHQKRMLSDVSGITLAKHKNQNQRRNMGGVGEKNVASAIVQVVRKRKPKKPSRCKRCKKPNPSEEKEVKKVMKKGK